MRTCNSVFTTFVLAFFLTSCTSTQGRSPTQLAANLINRESITATTYDTYPPKSPQNVALFNTSQSPHAAYRVIGVAKVSKYNMLGIKRQTDTLDSMMKKLAASIGGDGLIDITPSDDQIQAKVIAYQKILI